MKAISSLFSSQKGETLVEALVAILISALSLVMLAGAISSSIAMISSSKQKLENYYIENNELAERSTPGVSKTARLTVDGVTHTYNIEVYTNSESGSEKVSAYKEVP